MSSQRKNNAADEDDDIVESRDEDLRRVNSMDAFLSRMKSTIIQWRTYLASLNGDTLVLSNAKVDEFVAMVEHAQKIHREGEIDDTPTRKRKREEEEADSDHSPTFKGEMECVDENMRRAPPPGLSHRTSFGKITSEGRCPGASGRPRVRTNVRVGRPPADGRLADGPSGRPPGGRPRRMAQADGPGGRPVLR
jgi:hypothetical protein